MLQGRHAALGLLLLQACVTPSAASPQAELARLARPWQRAAAWLHGEPSAAKKLSQRRRHLHEAAAEGEHPEHEGMSEAELEELEKELEAIEESKIKWGFVVGILALGATFIGGYILELNHITRLPEAGVGMIMGMLVSYFAVQSGNDVMSSHEKFDFEFFMTWLLPPIIFEAGYNMNVGAFMANLGPTMFFAFIGTFASTFVVGGIVYSAGQAGICYPLGMLASLLFGSLISATDPVTVLAVFQALGVKVDLFSMVFGESVLNDAVAIVLSRTLLGFNAPGTVVDADSILAACASFCTIFGGSLLIGAFAGILSALVFKGMDMRHHKELVFMQSSLSFAFPWAAYFTSEALELSGIVTILFCGMIMAVYTRYNMAEEARVCTAQGYKCVAVVAETYVFVYLGMAVFTFPIFQSTVVMLILVATLACFVGRLHIYVGSCLTNCFRGAESYPSPISGVYMFIMWFSGLRGGVAFALASVSFAAMDFPDTCGGLTADAKINDPHCADPEMSDSLAILQTTLAIATFTIFVFGGAITEVAIAGDVLATPEWTEENEKKAAAQDPGCTGACHTNTLTPWLTFNEHVKETGLRQDAAVVHTYEEPVSVKPVYMPTPTGPGMSTTEIKKNLSVSDGIEMVSIDDKIDEMRTALPGKSSDQLKKLLDEANGDTVQAIRIGQSRGFD